ncbi:6465af14-7bb7-46a5-be5a-de25dd712fdd [Thermothielavioides terrestris]|uniref:chitinase n=1 Tax=Thermothielavioides terrestris TaxID=2587410 RepID=A0A446BBJ3_9PEZI|nr:6465af14-7bb7-46a5-be5a-de25dd712fdd [Thermothielavioides terrestris]
MCLPRPFRAPAVALLAWSALVRHAAAQVTTDCFPMNKTCPPDIAFGTDYNFNFTSQPNVDVWETTVNPVEWDPDAGAIFRITKQGDSPTIRTKFYYFWGRTEIHMKAAKGTGVISSMMMLSDNLDEIDWEFFGGNDTIAQSNYFGKGVPDFHNAGLHTVPGGVHDDYHNYTTVWTKDSLLFYIDNQLVRTLLPKDANNSYYYPQTPMRLSIGIWAGGDPRLPNGTREWAGGTTDYSQGPFEMYVKSAHITDFSSGKEYEYTDRSGSWESIKIVAGNSTIKDEVNAPPAMTLSQRWNALPTGAKIAIYACAGGFGGLLIIAALYYCIRQRRRGAREAKAAEARAEAERLELERFKKAGVDPDSFVSSASEYNAKEMQRDHLAGKDGYSVPPSPTMSAIDPASPLDNRPGPQSPHAASANNYPDRPGSSHSNMSSRRSPAPPGGGFSQRDWDSRSPAPAPSSPRHAPSPAPSMRQQQQFAQSPPNRSYTAPSAQMRRGTPAPSAQHQHDFDAGAGIHRSASPAQLAHPQPQRSFTTGGLGGAPDNNRGYDGGGGGGGGGGNQGYWGDGARYR